jgi:dihydropyrimidinase
VGFVLQGGKIVTTLGIITADVLVEGEKVIAIGSNLTSDEAFDVSGCYLLPGGIDCHTHFDLEVAGTITADDFQSGTKAALVGGTTTIIDYATQKKRESLKLALDNQFQKTNNKCFCDFGFHMGITDWNNNTVSEMKALMACGVTSFKLYMAYKGTLQVDDGVIYKALKTGKDLGALITFHCENGDVIDVLVNEAKLKGELEPLYHALTRPSLVEKEAVTRCLDLAELADHYAYIVHLSTEAGLDRIIAAKERGVRVLVETCPQYLLLDDSRYKTEGEKYVMSPPLRKQSDNKALLAGLKNGIIDTVATDHCSFNFAGQKNSASDFSKIPNGAPGVEHRLSLLYTYGVLKHHISIQQLVALTSTNVAKIFGLYPKKGTIEVGSDADIVVLDPNFKTTISYQKQIQNVDYTPYEGFSKKGKIRYTFLRGTKVVDNEQICIKHPTGKYQYRKPFKGGM